VSSNWAIPNLFGSSNSNSNGRSIPAQQERSSSQQRHGTKDSSKATAITTQPKPKLQEEKQKKPAQVWKSAKDKKTGRTYYYDTVTRQTQWQKPLELATDEERRAIANKEKKQKDFFSAMEANMLKSMAGGSLVPASSRSGSLRKSGSNYGSDEEDREEGIAEMSSRTPTKQTSGLLPKGLKPNCMPVRTISSMDDALIAELAKTGQKSPFDRSATKVSPQSISSFPFDDETNNDAKTPLVSHLHASFPVPMKRSSSSSPSSASSASSTGSCTPPRTAEDRAIDQFRMTAAEMAAMSLNDKDEIASADVSEPSLLQLQSIPRPTLQQRNTCGTLYVSSTMSDPDKDATIKCVCGIYRAHIVQAAHEEINSGFRSQVKFDEYEIFNDLRSERGAGLRGEVSLSPSTSLSRSSYSVDTRDEPPIESSPSIEVYSPESIESIVPSLEEITKFYRDVFRRSQMETDCIIMSLIYIERLIKVTAGGVRPRIGNWRSLLFASMIMSSKVWDDLSMWSGDFSQLCPAGIRFPLKRINELELAMLNCMKFNVTVLSSEYAKYYFLLRCMCIRSGLAGQDLIEARALDIEGARKIEDLSSRFERSHHIGENGGLRTSPSSTSNANTSPTISKPTHLGNHRSKSMGDVERSTELPSTPFKGSMTQKVHLEKIVPM